MVVTIFLVPALVLTVVFVPAIVVPIAVMVPVMVVLDTPVRTAPVATVVATLFIVWDNPSCANIRRTSPVASVPRIMTVHRIPVAIDPHVIGPRLRRDAVRARRRRRRADVEVERNLRMRCRRECEEQR